VGKGRRTADSIDAADAKILEEFDARSEELQRFTPSEDISSADANFGDWCKLRLRNITKGQQEIRAKVRMMSRRNVDSEAMTRLQEMDTFFEALNKFARGLHPTFAMDGDELFTCGRDLIEGQVSCSPPVLRRLLKAKCLSDLKLSRWHGLVDQTRQDMLNMLGAAAGEAFFELMVSQLLQRLVKAVPPANALSP